MQLPVAFAQARRSLRAPRRRSVARLRASRILLQVEALEERCLLAAGVPWSDSLTAFDRPFTKTEVVAEIHSPNPLATLATGLHQPSARAVTGSINLQTSRVLFASHGNATVQVDLTAGADPLRVVRRLQGLPFVRWVSPNFVYDPAVSGDPREFIPDDPLYASQYHHPLMHNDLAWDITLGQATVVIAITDDGQDLRHDDLYLNIAINQGEIPASRLANLVDVYHDGRITFRDLNDPVNQGPFKIMDLNQDGRIDAADILAPMDRDADGNDLGTGGWATGQDKDGNGYIDDLVGWNFSSIPNNNDPNPAGQDTHGTHVAGIAAARIDNSVGVAGVAGHASILPIRFYGSGPWTSTVIASSYAYAAENGARIVSTSYNVDRFVNDPIFMAGLDYLYDHGGLHFGSAGNNDQLNPPRQSFDQTLYVAATNPFDRKARYSNYGFGVDISAPGDSILSSLRNNRYGYLSGTSMAAPNAAGVAALIWSVHPDWTREQVAAQLIGTADNLDAVNPAYAGLLGSGRVNSFRAVTETLRPPQLKRKIVGLPNEEEITTASLTTFQVDVANVFDPASIQDLSNWEMREAGPDGLFDTDDDVRVPLTLTTTYKIGTNRLTFILQEPLPPGHYRFRAQSGGLQDPFGNPLDGDGSGQGGTPFDRTFYVAAPNGPSGRSPGPDAALLFTELATGSNGRIPLVAPQPATVLTTGSLTAAESAAVGSTPAHSAVGRVEIQPHAAKAQDALLGTSDGRHAWAESLRQMPDSDLDLLARNLLAE